MDDVYTVDRTTGAIALESVTAERRRRQRVEPAAAAERRRPNSRVHVARAKPDRAGLEPLGSQVLRRDRATGTTTLVSHTPAGRPGHGWSGLADISDDGRYIVFESQATDLVAGPDANHGGSDIYLHDAADGTVQRISLTDTGGHSASGQSWTPAISSAGRLVAFTSTAPIDAAARARPDEPVRSVFVRDVVTGETRRLSATRSGGVPDGASFHPTISGDGRRTVFVSVASDLAGAERRTRRQQLYLHDSRHGPAAAAHANRLGRRRGRGPAAARRSAATAGSWSSPPTPPTCRAPAAAGRSPISTSSPTSTAWTSRPAPSIASAAGSGRARRGGARAAAAAVDRTGRVVAFSSRQPVDDADLDDDDDLYVAVLDAGSHAGGPAGVDPCTAPPPPQPWPRP